MRLSPESSPSTAPCSLIWLGLVLLFGALSENFLSARTFVTLANRIPALTVIAAA